MPRLHARADKNSDSISDEHALSQTQGGVDTLQHAAPAPSWGYTALNPHTISLMMTVENTARETRKNVYHKSSDDELTELFELDSSNARWHLGQPRPRLQQLWYVLCRNVRVRESTSKALDLPSR